MFRFFSPDRPIFLEKLKKKKKSRITCKDEVGSCLINTNCLKLSSILRFCSLFRHLIVLLIYIFYHLIISCRLNVRFNMQSCVHSFFVFFFLPDRPSHLHERESDGKRNILWGWPNTGIHIEINLTYVNLGLLLLFLCNPYSVHGPFFTVLRLVVWLVSFSYIMRSKAGYCVQSRLTNLFLIKELLYHESAQSLGSSQV